MSFHHFYPNTKWHEASDGVYLCVECHRDFHKFAGERTYRRDSLKRKLWYFTTFIKWIAGLTLAYLLWIFIN